MPDSPSPGRPQQPRERSETFAERPQTVLETDEDMRTALLAGMKGGQNLHAPPASPAAAQPPALSVGRPARPYRPTARPPVPILTVFDDGESEGESVRIRLPHFIIGRTEGSLRFPLDGRMSSRHVEITLQSVAGAHRWVVTDLRSTHGMYVRVRRTVLGDKAEFLVGGGRYRFDAGQASDGGATDLVEGAGDTAQTQGWAGAQPSFRPPALTELIGDDIGNRAILVQPEYWIGADPSCSIARIDDPFSEPRHVRVSRDPKGSWYAEHNKTRNGLWLRMPQIVLESMIQFQAGEQRFRLMLK